MNIRVAQTEDIETLFEIRTSVKENYQSREEIAQLGITPESVAQMLKTDCCAWLAEINGQDVGFSLANATEKKYWVYLFILNLNSKESVVPSFKRQKTGYGHRI